MDPKDELAAASLSALITPTPLGDNLFELHVPDGWQQGRGAFGGLVLGALARALELAEPAEPAEPSRSPRRGGRPLRSLSGALGGPVQPGVAEIEVQALRRGAGVSTVQATLRQGGEALAQATGVLGRARPVDPRFAPPPPPELSIPWRDIAALPVTAAFEGDGTPGGAARFVAHFEARPTGPLPFAGATEAVAAGWVQARTPLSALDGPEVVALADVWWPAVLAITDRPRPAATVAYTAQLFPTAAAGVDPAEPVFHRARTVTVADGYAVELRELWSARGDLLALNQQTFVIIK